MFKKISYFTKILTLFGLGFGFTLPAFAQATSDLNVLGVGNLKDLIDGITNFLFTLAPFVVTLVLVWGGYQYFLGGFDKKSDGRRAIQAAILGYALILLAKFITSTASQVFSVDPNGGRLFNVDPVIRLLTSVVNDGFLPLAGIVAVFVIMYGGYQYFLGSFDKKANGRETIANGVIGLIVVLLAFPIQNLIKNVFSQNGSAQLVLNTSPIVSFILQVLNKFLIPLSSVITVTMFIIGGYYMITSAGDNAKYKKGLDVIRNAIFGLLIVLFSFTLSQLIIYIVPLIGGK
jgi:Type IV secretion system pilin